MKEAACMEIIPNIEIQAFTVQCDCGIRTMHTAREIHMKNGVIECEGCKRTYNMNNVNIKVDRGGGLDG
jgi:hypothetical protein